MEENCPGGLSQTMRKTVSKRATCRKHRLIKTGQGLPEPVSPGKGSARCVSPHSHLQENHVRRNPEAIPQLFIECVVNTVLFLFFTLFFICLFVSAYLSLYRP